MIMKETHNKQSWRRRGLDLKKTHKKCSVMANLMNIEIHINDIIFYFQSPTDSYF